MKIAVVGSRSISPDESCLEEYLLHAEEIVSGGAKGVDLCAASYAKQKGIKLREFLPNYSLYGRAAPIVRNREIVDYADRIVVFWDGSSKGAQSVISYARKLQKDCTVVFCGEEAPKKEQRDTRSGIT